MGESAAGATTRRASALALVLGLGTLYTVWGSTYLAIRVAVETIPPFLMAGVRFLVAGTLLYIWARLTGSPRPAGVHWRLGVIIGGLLLLCGNGGVVWAEKSVPSGLAALIVTTMPLFMAIFDWLRPHGVRPPVAVWLGLFAGFAGMAGLALWGKGIGGNAIDPLAVAALVLASVAWAFGSIFAKHSPRPSSPFMATAVQMLCGGALLLIASALGGELSGFRLSQVSGKSLGGFFYLLVMGSLLTMTVYTWLLHVIAPTLIATYAFVNPVIAVLLGWALADEQLTSQTLIAGVVIVVAVAWLVAVQWRQAARIRFTRWPRRRIVSGATRANLLDSTNS